MNEFYKKDCKSESLLQEGTGRAKTVLGKEETTDKESLPCLGAGRAREF